MRKRLERRTNLAEEIYTVKIKRDAITGVAVTEYWYQDRFLHRDAAPACILRDAITGIAINESWWQKSKLHREDGPASILRKPDGRVYFTEWYMHGEKIRPPRPPRRTPASKNGQMPPKPSGPGS